MELSKREKEFSFDPHIEEYEKELKIRKRRLRQFITKDYAEYNGDTTIYTILEITIRNIYEYFTLNHYVFAESKDTIKSLRKCIDLFEHINKAELEEESNAFFNKHCKVVTKKTDSVSTMEFVWDSQKNREKYQIMSKKAEKDRKDSMKKLFKYIAKHMEEWWD